jgi:hypothetical protein
MILVQVLSATKRVLPTVRKCNILAVQNSNFVPRHPRKGEKAPIDKKQCVLPCTFGSLLGFIGLSETRRVLRQYHSQNERNRSPLPTTSNTGHRPG